MTTKEECSHDNIEMSYGYGSGLKGIGAYRYCADCDEILDYILDYESCTKEEIEWYEKSEWDVKI